MEDFIFAGISKYVSFSLSDLILFCFCIWLYFQNKQREQDLKEFQKFQENRCQLHREEGAKWFDKFDKKLDDISKIIFDRLEMTNTKIFEMLNRKD